MSPVSFDLAATPLREVNQYLHGAPESLAGQQIEIFNSDGAHNIAVGLNAPVSVTVPSTCCRRGS